MAMTIENLQAQIEKMQAMLEQVVLDKSEHQRPKQRGKYRRKRLTSAMIAELLDTTANSINIRMQRGLLPIGRAYPPVEEGGKWSYEISPIQLMMYTGLKKSAIEEKCGIDLSDYQEPTFIALDPAAMEVLKLIASKASAMEFLNQKLGKREE